MSTAEERDEFEKLIGQALDAARAIDEGVVGHNLEMALDEAARPNREARLREMRRRIEP